MTQQAAFDAPWMHLGSEMLLDQAHQFQCPHGRLLLACLDEEGQDLTEYALLLVLISLIAVASLKTAGQAISDAFSNAAANLTTTT